MQESSVIFYAETNILQKTTDGNSLRKSTRCENVTNLRELQNFCDTSIQHKNNIDRGTYKIRLWFDTIITCHCDDLNIPPRKVRMEGDHFSFMMSSTNKLLYIEDAKKLFPNSDILQLDDKYILHPLCVQNFDGQKIKLRPLNDKDIVVDKNLHQLWPIQTNLPPTQLVDILNRNANKGIAR